MQVRARIPVVTVVCAISGLISGIEICPERRKGCQGMAVGGGRREGREREADTQVPGTRARIRLIKARIHDAPWKMELSRRRNSSRWRQLRRGRQRPRRWRLRTIDVSTRPRGSNEVSPVRSVPRLGRGSSPICSSYGRGENKSAERVASSRQRERERERERERGGGIAGCPGWVPVGAGARCNSLRL